VARGPLCRGSGRRHHCRRRARPGSPERPPHRALGRVRAPPIGTSLAENWPSGQILLCHRRRLRRLFGNQP
jgi:hypothetical protein